MDHVYSLLMLIVPCSVLCGHISAPVNLTMDSHHFIHLLTWQAGPGSPAGLHYRVHIRSVTEDWKMVDSCGAVHFPLCCNLTDDFSTLGETYYINVTAVLGNETSTPRSYRPFKPVDDTVLELPSLRVSPCNDSLCVYLQSPSERLDAVYKKFHYTLNFTNEKEVQFSETIVGLDTVYQKVVPGLWYCVSVKIKGRHSASKPPVCAYKPAAVNNMDAVISVFLCLLMLMIVIIVGRMVPKCFINLKTRQPSVLSSFQAPYEIHLLPLPTEESLKRISLEPNKYEEIQVNEDIDQENEDEEVAYEGRKGFEEEMCCKEISEEPVSPEIQHEYTHSSVTETYAHVPGTLLAPDMITPTSQTTSQILTTYFLPLKTPIQEFEKNDFALLWHKGGDELGQEEGEEEDSDNVNFFSLTLGGQNSGQDEVKKEDHMEDLKNIKPEISLFMFGPPNPATDIQPTPSESKDKHISYSEEEEEEDTEEEEAFSGYMLRS